VRLGQRGAAVDAWRRTLRLAPGYGDAEVQLLAVGIDSGLVLPAVRRPGHPDVPARAAGDGFETRAAGGWQPFYVKGVNLGVALPGNFPSQFPTDDSTYGRCLELIAGARANAIRVYTILPPAFYRALKAGLRVIVVCLPVLQPLGRPQAQRAQQPDGPGLLAWWERREGAPHRPRVRRKDSLN